MTRIPPTGLLDVPPVTAAEIAAVEDAAAALLDAPAALLVQGEAVLALEAAAAGLAHPGVRALNVVTGPYGAWFGRLLARGGAEVRQLQVAPRHAVDPADVEEELRRHPVDVLAVVQAEAATGATNDIDAIAALARAHGALLVVDAVASVGAEEVSVRRWGAGVVVLGGQKGLAGPAGVSVAAVSDAAWSAMAANPRAPRESVLSLLDAKDRWLDAGRRAVVGTPGTLETLALGLALARVSHEGLPAVIARHAAAAAATRAGLRALGLTLWVPDDAHAAPVATTVLVPPGAAVVTVLAAARAAGSTVLSPAPVGTAGVVRVVHAGQAATPGLVAVELTALAAALGRDPDPALAAARAAGRPRT